VQVRTYLKACGADKVAGKVKQTTACMVAVCSIVAKEDNESAAAAAVPVLEVVGVCRFGCLLTGWVDSRTHRRLGQSGRKEQGWIAPCQHMLEASYLEVTVVVVVAVRELVRL
jgi:hypothetical protein